MPKINFNKFIHSFIELSTMHITKGDDELFLSDPAPLIVHDLDPGWLIFVPVQRDDPDFWAALTKSAFSPALKSLLMKAEKARCRYLRLDPDAEVHRELPNFKW